MFILNFRLQIAIFINTYVKFVAILNEALLVIPQFYNKDW
jgi:hypothetical protein